MANTHKSKQTHGIVDPEPLLDADARVEPPGHGEQDERHEDAVDDDQARTLGDGVVVVGFGEGEEDGKGWNAHFRCVDCLGSSR